MLLEKAMKQYIKDLTERKAMSNYDLWMYHTNAFLFQEFLMEKEVRTLKEFNKSYVEQYFSEHDFTSDNARAVMVYEYISYLNDLKKYGAKK